MLDTLSHSRSSIRSHAGPQWSILVRLPLSALSLHKNCLTDAMTGQLFRYLQTHFVYTAATYTRFDPTVPLENCTLVNTAQTSRVQVYGLPDSASHIT